MQYSRRRVCTRQSFRLRYIFSSHANTRRDGTTLSYTRAETDRPNSLFCANTSRAAHAESHTNINHIYCRPNETLSAKTADASRTASASLAVFHACEPRPLSTRKPCATWSVREPEFPCYQIKPHPFDDVSEMTILSPPIRLDMFLFHGRNTRSDLLIFSRATSCLCEYVVLTWLERPVPLFLLF